MNRKIIFQTEDGVEIVGEYREASKEAPWVLLLHMMPATRISWYPFMEKLRAVEFSSLAIDFRGHGESIRKFSISNSQFSILDYKKFTDEEQQEKILDVRAAVEWLEKNKSLTFSRGVRSREKVRDKGMRKDALVLVGASIGANLTLQYMTENPEIKKGVLLSPGLNYRGVKTDVLVKKLHPNQHVLLLASSDDTHGSFESIRELNRLNPTQAEKWEFSNLNHGTTMFDRKPELMNEVITWIQ